MEIEKAVEAADVVLVCVSTNSVTKEGYVQRELKFALDVALEKPEGTIFIVPLRLDDCNLPRRLRTWQYVDYFPTQQRERAYQKLLQSLRLRLGVSRIQIEETTVKPLIEKRDTPISEPEQLTVSIQDPPTGIIDLGWSILPIIFFAMMALYGFGYTDDDYEILVGIVGILTSLLLIYKRQSIDNKFVKYSTILFIITHNVWIYSEYNGWGSQDFLLIINSIVALFAFGARFLNFKAPSKQGIYSSIFFALFIVLYGIKLIFNSFGIHPNVIQTPMIVFGLIATILLWFEQ